MYPLLTVSFCLFQINGGKRKGTRIMLKYVHLFVLQTLTTFIYSTELYFTDLATITSIDTALSKNEPKTYKPFLWLCMTYEIKKKIQFS